MSAPIKLNSDLLQLPWHGLSRAKFLTRSYRNAEGVSHCKSTGVGGDEQTDRNADRREGDEVPERRDEKTRFSSSARRDSEWRMPATEPIMVEVVIEVPRGSFVKRGSTGHIDFVSPLPCPFNYGSVPNYVGLEGDLLDAIVLGRRLPFGTKLAVKAWGAVTLIDRGMADDKLVCSERPVTALERNSVLAFFGFYAMCKAVLNLSRGRSGRNRCAGWRSAQSAIRRATPRDETWTGSRIEF
jgi:inorganic pyrophosphatase